MVHTEYACLTTEELINYVLNTKDDSLLVELAQRLQIANDMLDESDEMAEVMPQLDLRTLRIVNG